MKPKYSFPCGDCRRYGCATIGNLEGTAFPMQGSGPLRPQSSSAGLLDRFAHSGIVANVGGVPMAGTDQIDILFHGVGGHGSMPQLAKDPVIMAALAVVEYYCLSTYAETKRRRRSAGRPAPSSFGFGGFRLFPQRSCAARRVRSEFGDALVPCPAARRKGCVASAVLTRTTA